jgi:hypothetical protein
MIRRPTRTFIATSITSSQQPSSDRTFKYIPPAILDSEQLSRSSYGYNNIIFSTKLNIHRTHRRKPISESKQYWIRTLTSLAGGFFFCFWISYYKLSKYSTKTTSDKRLSNGSLSNDNYTIVLSQRRHQPSFRIFSVPVGYLLSSNGYDFGGLDLQFLKNESFRQGRVVEHDIYEETAYDELWDAADDDGDVDSYYAFDDDEKRNPLVLYDDPDINLRKKCRRTNWHRQLPITCNMIHEFGFQNNIQIGDTKFLGYVCSKIAGIRLLLQIRCYS